MTNIPDLPNNWRRLTTQELEEYRATFERIAQETHEDDHLVIDHCDRSIDQIDDELDLRRHPDPSEACIDTDEQDRRAASEERIENHRRER